MKWLLKLHYCQFMVSSHFTGVPDDDMAGVQVGNAEVQKKIWKWITCRFYIPRYSSHNCLETITLWLPQRQCS